MYRIESGERVGESLRRVVLEEFARALEWLASSDRPFDLRIHETRQCLKRVRSLTDLGRAVFAAEAREDLYAAARDAARFLAATRERAALLSALEELATREGEALEPGVLANLREAVAGTAQGESDAESRIASAREIIDRARFQAERLEGSEDGWAALEPGFRATYRSARRALAAARRRGEAELLHEFRTPAKRHLHHVRLLELTWPGPLAALRLELSRLGDLLGDHHDLYLLGAELRRRPELESVVMPLMPRVRKRLDDLERDALSLSLHLFAEKPGAAARRFGAYFSAWR